MLLLGPGGRTVFLGPSRLALPYLEMLGFALPPNENPAGALVISVCGGEGAGVSCLWACAASQPPPNQQRQRKR